jgi:3alpha(or 20beta)-hydroxysteroid dehydrogenase
MGRLDGRVAIVTGGARVMGAAEVRALAAEGARVVAGDVLDGDGRALAQELGEGARYEHLDVRSEEDWARTLAAAESSYGPVSVLVNNAGVVEFSPIEQQRPEAFRRVLDINLYGTWLGMHVVAPSMRRAGGGVIVNVSSTAGLMGMANLGAYVASKWGIRGLTKTAALELGRAGIRVCSVHPGPIHTPMTAGMDESLVAAQPLNRFGEPDEVARLVLFLVADASYSTGCEFVIDGGQTAGTVIETPTQ